MKRFLFFIFVFGVFTEGVMGQSNPPTPGSSNACNLNVNCYNQYATLKKSVVYTSTYSLCGNCSGVILNNTQQDGKLYLLTASHCVSPVNILNGREIYWGYEQKCLIPQLNNYDAFTERGKVILRQIDRSLDFALFEIKTLPNNYIPFYAGWDFSGSRSNVTKPLVIHHPMGDFKKIGTPELLQGTSNPPPQFVDELCILLNYTFASNSMWQYKFTQGNGLIESGSSGSPIFDDLKRVIGITIYKDPNTQDCIDKKMLGTRFQLIYPHIKSYLDPQKSGVLKIDGYDPSNPCADTYEGNNTIAVAKTESIFPDLGIADFNGFLQSKISSLTDVDYYSLTLKNKGGFKLSLKNVSDRFKIELFEENATQALATSSLVNGIESLEYLYTGNLEKKVYAKVSVASGVTSLSDCPKYKLEINYKECYDAYEDNNTKEKASAAFKTNQMNMPQTQSLEAVISSSIDNDWYRVGIEGKGILTVDLQNLPQNYQLVLYGLDGKTILAKSLNTGTTNEHLTYTYLFDQSTIGYIKVYGESNVYDNCTPYKLIINWQPAAPCEIVNFIVGQNNTSSASASDGAIFLTRLSGLEPIKYHWSTGAITPDISNLEEGYYTVTATAYDGCTFIHTTHITSNVPSGAYCSGTLNLSNPSGSFSDKSGASDYTNDSYCRWKIAPLNARSITLRFTSFKLHSSDYVRIFDGGSVGAPLLAEYRTDTIPPSVTSSGGVMYVQFVADAASTSEGFSAAYTTTVDDGINQITSYNLWFDDKFKDRLNFDISPSNTYTVQANIPTGGLAVGLHSINFRFNDQYDQSSPITTDLFVKTPVIIEGDNIGIVGYEYWFDNGFDNRISSGFDATTTLNFNEALEVADLSYGLHSFNIRFLDNANNWSVTTTDLFVKERLSTNGSSQIVAYEYWFDDKFGNKVSQTITPTETYTLISNLNVAALSYGLHLLNVRFKDAAGQWSVTTTDLFIKEKMPTNGTSKIIRFQYWFDDDFQNKVSQDVTPTDLYTLINDIPTTGLLNGTHTISFRFSDNIPAWSPIIKDTFTKSTVLPVELSKFVGKCQEDKVVLQWQTTTEKNSSHFELMYSTSPQSGWKTMTNIASKGNSSTASDYNYTFDNPTRLTYYRLRQVDKDGRIFYSPTIAVECAGKEHYLKVYPNPSDNFVYLETDVNEGTLIVEIYNVYGQQVLKKQYDSGFYPVEIPLTSIEQAGTYIVKVLRGNGEIVGVRRLVVN